MTKNNIKQQGVKQEKQLTKTNKNPKRNTFTKFYEDLNPLPSSVSEKSDIGSENENENEFQDFFVKSVKAINKFKVKNKEIIQKKFLETQEKFQQQQEKIKNDFKKQQEIIKQKIDERKNKFLQKVKTSQFRRKRDKFGFVLGVFDLALTAYLVGSDIYILLLWHSILMILLIGIRYYRYKQKKWQYYCVDFCYYANILSLIYIWFFPKCQWLFEILYTFCMGTLLGSIPLFRNSIVFHSLDRLTSVKLHAAAPLIFLCLRWYDVEERFVKVDSSQFDILYFLRIFFNSLIGYMVWVICYYIEIFVIFKKDTVYGDYDTSYSYITQSENNWKQRYCNKFGKKYSGALYLSLHVIYFSLASILSLLQFQYKAFNWIFYITIMLWGTYNGASFYMDYFSKKYEIQLKEYDNLHRYVEKSNESDYLKSIESDTSIDEDTYDKKNEQKKID